MWQVTIAAIASLVATAAACEGDHSCYGPLKDDVVLTRNVRRMQPDAQNATTSPKAPLEWGQINFLHTTDTHGWLEGHIKEKNYGADWGGKNAHVNIDARLALITYLHARRLC
jgi:2',3'-cyclic-nucleotide 2'-phosphodiesterase (5'-nucleotidase family)